MKCHDVSNVCSCCYFNMAILIMQVVMSIMRLFGA